MSSAIVLSFLAEEINCWSKKKEPCQALPLYNGIIRVCLITQWNKVRNGETHIFPSPEESFHDNTTVSAQTRAASFQFIKTT